MSDCMAGVNPRLFYPRELKSEVKSYDQTEPIRFRVIYEGGLRPTEFTAGRVVFVGDEPHERKVRFIEADGKRYTFDPVDLVERYDDGKCYEVVVDGVEYTRKRTCTLTRTYEGNPCSDWTCSECGKVHTEHNMARVNAYCPRCGAEVGKVVMEPWNSAAATPEMRGRPHGDDLEWMNGDWRTA